MTRMRSTDWAEHVRSVAAGETVPGCTVLRLADCGDDALMLVLAGGREWWVAARRGGTVSVSWYVGDIEADRGFDRQLASYGGAAAGWRETEDAATA